VKLDQWDLLPQEEGRKDQTQIMNHLNKAFPDPTGSSTISDLDHKDLLDHQVSVANLEDLAGLEHQGNPDHLGQLDLLEILDHQEHVVHPEKMEPLEHQESQDHQVNQVFKDQSVPLVSQDNKGPSDTRENQEGLE